MIKVKFYSLGEEIFNTVTHGVGTLLALVGSAFLIVKAAGIGAAAVVSCAIYGFALFVLYTMSSLYHALAHNTAKAVMRIFDHCTIFLLITGTYTPFTLVTLSGALGWTIFGVLCALSVLGITLNAVSIERFKKVSMVFYILMGWCIIFAVQPLLTTLPLNGFILLIAGGLFYTVGIIFYKMKKVKYMHSVWHLFVLAGSIFHYFSIYFYVL